MRCSVVAAAALTFALSLAEATSVAAQTLGDSALHRALEQLREREVIQIALLRSRWIGELRGVRGDTVFLGPRNQPPMAIRFNAIDTLWHEVSRGRQGGIVGSSVGFVLGGFAVVVAARAREGPQGFRAADLGRALVGGALVGTTGALVGAAIGSSVKRWRRVYPER